MEKVPVAKVGTAYDHPETGETYIFIFGQALYLGDKLEHSLICPNQARQNGVVVDDVPRHLSHDEKSTHSLYFPDENVRLPLMLRGVISYLPTRYPSNHELDNCRWLSVTGEDEWEPYDEAFEEREKHVENNDEKLHSHHVYQVHSSHANADLSSHVFHQCRALATTGHKLMTTDQQIADIFQCGPKIAVKTRLVTTQKGISSMSDHLSHRFRTKQAALRHNQLGGRYGHFHSDTIFASLKSLHGNNMGQIFVNNVGYMHFIPMKVKSEAGYALQEFIQDVGIPSALHTDGAKELTEGKWREVCKTHGIKQTFTEPHSPFQNRAEVNIRELKKHTRRSMQQTKTPLRLWDLCASYVAELRSLTAQPLYSLHGRTPFGLVTGNTPDISECIAFHWFQPVWYFDHTSFPEPTRHIARWIGVAHNVGQAMCYWILPESGIPIARSTVQPMDDIELHHTSVQA
jgi:hypothetical protein